MEVLLGRRIVLGVSGSIAAYKAAYLASRLTQLGAEVDTVLTAGATRFITPLTFQSLTGRACRTDGDLWAAEGHVVHVGLGEQAELLVIAPATADLIAKLAAGIAEGLLLLTALAARCPIVIAPAMDGAMYGHQATQENLATLAARGVIVLGPAEGRMASGLSGPGRMMEPEEIVERVELLLGAGV
ncbi:MAG: hypothetical protein EXR72_24910 [Myxococcales bacterium]|nr:hypothetical protein [Myxococcales bacterium]